MTKQKQIQNLLHKLITVPEGSSIKFTKHVDTPSRKGNHIEIKTRISTTDYFIGFDLKSEESYPNNIIIEK